jgi:hypothetical protein
MRTIIIFQQVDDVDEWLASPTRHEIFGPLGITARTFVAHAQPGLVGLVVEVPSMAAFEEAMGAPGAGAMQSGGGRPETFVVLTEHRRE